MAVEDIIKIDDPIYIIIREKDGEKEYFNGANLYGRDSGGVLRISKIKWSKTFLPINATHEQNRMKDILDGMCKYGEIENRYNYSIAKIQTTIAIVDYIVE